MKATGIVRSIDKLGRFVIPMELRRQLDVASDDANIEVFVDDDKIILKKYHPTCTFCDNSEDIVSLNGKNVCKACIEKLVSLKEITE